MFIKRGDIWMVDFSPTEGHEQSGTRPAVVMSSNDIDVMTTELVFVIPGTRTARTDPSTNELLPDVVRVEPSSLNNLSAVTYFLCDHLRSASIKRFVASKKMGRVTDQQMTALEDILFFLLDLPEKDV